jgi:hypothetical protein
MSVRVIRADEIPVTGEPVGVICKARHDKVRLYTSSDGAAALNVPASALGLPTLVLATENWRLEIKYRDGPRWLLASDVEWTKSKKAFSFDAPATKSSILLGQRGFSPAEDACAGE